MKTCTFAECEKKLLARGYCSAHYAQWSRGIELKPARPYMENSGCIVSSCDLKHVARGYCKKHWKILTRYNIDPVIYENKMLEQGGVCAICKKECKSGVSLSIDHNHLCCEDKGTSCGKCIRGLLCYTCNMGIGFLQDDVEILNNAIDYLNSY